METIREYVDSELTGEIAHSIAALACRAFSDSQRTYAQRVAEILDTADNSDLAKKCARRFVVWRDGKAIAHARTFVRHVFAEDTEIPVLALASVCSDPEKRGQGLGAVVTRKAFEVVVEANGPHVSLFQSPVPDFYRKLNCKVITNRFVDRTNNEDPEANPWRSSSIMIFPSEYPWPDGVIDLNGPAY